MLRASGKKNTPLLMILVLIAAVTPLPLRAMGINLNVTTALCSIINTYGRAVSFVGWAYQPALVAELNALRSELPCDKPNPEATPACDQVACNQERLTIEELIIERPLSTSEIEPQPLLPSASAADSIGMLRAAGPRVMRMTGKTPAVTTVHALSAEPIIRMALAQVGDIPRRLKMRNEFSIGFETHFVTRPAARQTPAIDSEPRNVRVLLPVVSREATKVDFEAAGYEMALRYAQKLETMKLTCNFKGFKALQKKIRDEEQAVKAERTVVKSQAKAAPEAVEPVTLPEFMYSEF